MLAQMRARLIQEQTVSFFVASFVGDFVHRQVPRTCGPVSQHGFDSSRPASIGSGAVNAEWPITSNDDCSTFFVRYRWYIGQMFWKPEMEGRWELARPVF